jgi:hypothetical protein
MSGEASEPCRHRCGLARTLWIDSLWACLLTGKSDSTYAGPHVQRPTPQISRLPTPITLTNRR